MTVPPDCLCLRCARAFLGGAVLRCPNCGGGARGGSLVRATVTYAQGWPVEARVFGRTIRALAKASSPERARAAKPRAMSARERWALKAQQNS